MKKKKKKVVQGRLKKFFVKQFLGMKIPEGVEG